MAFQIFKRKLHVGWVGCHISGTKRATRDLLVSKQPDFWGLFSYLPEGRDGRCQGLKSPQLEVYVEPSLVVTLCQCVEPNWSTPSKWYWTLPINIEYNHVRSSLFASMLSLADLVQANVTGQDQSTVCGAQLARHSVRTCSRTWSSSS